MRYTIYLHIQSTVKVMDDYLGSNDICSKNLYVYTTLSFVNMVSGGSRRQRSADLSAFVTGEYVRHCQAVKRSLPSPPPHDVNMDSPTHPKRARFM